MSAIDHPEVMFPFLEPEEAAVYRWQYRLQGGFLNALWAAIAAADEENLDRLAKGFPIQVQGYRWYTTELGWWDAVETLIEQRKEMQVKASA